jgi:amino acid adenylation domain-containing protein
MRPQFATVAPDPPSGGEYGLHGGFLASVAKMPDRAALDVEGRLLTYRELNDVAASFADAIKQVAQGAFPFVGVFTSRSVTTYAAILGTLMAGRAVVPLNPAFPAQRVLGLIQDSGLDVVVLDAQTLRGLDKVFEGLDRPLTFIVPDATAADDLGKRWRVHRFVAPTHSDPGDVVPAVPVDPEAYAYLFFTSGSTGKPKGVGVLHRNAGAFVQMSVERYRACGVDEKDRFSQFYELSFDSSMFDLYICWAFGACLCSPSISEWINPNKYILDKQLTVIDIVPSMGQSMMRKGGWRAERFPQLKLCRFGGEALSAELCATLAAAAPNAIVENVYGPTECTVDACYYRWDRSRSMNECEHGMVPVGYAGHHVGLRIVNEALDDVPPDGEGELLIAGPQVTPGYWRNAEKTRDAFIRLPGSDDVHYRTGDLVRQPRPNRPIMFLGRFDHQIKIAGVRIELGEVEMALREAGETDLAVALGWPRTSSGASGIVAFLADVKVGLETISERLKRKLPNVMVPREIRLLDALPTNPNGKVDRKALLEMLGQPSASMNGGGPF